MQEPAQESIRQEVEEKIVALIHERLAHKQITGERARQIAQGVIKAIPKNMSDEEVLKILPHLDDEFVELFMVVHDISLEQDEKMNRK